VDVDTSTNSASKFVKAKFKELDSIGWPIRLKFPDNLKSRLDIVDRSGNVSFGWKFPEGFGVEASSTVRTNEGIQRWTYFESERIVGENKIKYLPKRIQVTPMNITFDKNEIEKVFFLIYCSGRCEVIDGLTDQAPAVHKTILLLDDKAREAKKLTIDRVAQAKVMSAIFGEDKISDDQVRLISKAYNRDGVDLIKEIDILRNWLFDVVTKNTSDKNAIASFLDAIKLPDEIRLRANIQQAKDLQLIISTKKGNHGSWKYIMSNGEDGEMIVQFNPTEKPMQAILNYAKANPDFASVLEAMIKERLGK